MRIYPNVILLILSSLLFSCGKEETQLTQDQVIQLESESVITGLSADGKTILNFKATIPADAVDEARNVTFTITQGLGTFQGTVINAENIVRADADGIARSSVKLGSTAGTFYISASVTANEVTYRSHDLPITLLEATPFSLDVSADNVQPEANGYTLVSITVTTTDVNEKTVELNTNLGSFTQATEPLKIELNFNSQGKAATILKISNQASPHIVSFSSALGKTALLQIHPTISRPQLLLVEPSTLITDTIGGSVQLSCYLKRSNPEQKVSIGHPVSFRAYQLIDGHEVEVGRFTGTAAAVSDATGAVSSVSFFADTENIDTSKAITIDCSTYKTESEKLHVLTTLRIKKQ